ncbi:hypothetical protein ACP275_05G001500 [Erythranthe tilingii]
MPIVCLFLCVCVFVFLRRVAERKVERFEKNITKRGSVVAETKSVKKGNDFPVGPVLLGFFIFVVIGSSLFQIIRTATSGGGGIMA